MEPMMNLYKLTVKETHYAYYEVEADSEDEAIESINDGIETPLDRRDYTEDIVNIRLIK
tara:strand:+ start:89 stop:265 length:177 start_codon:yes stop_codon:yes gene_type:complete